MNYLIHYGMPRRSGRYPWGSGDRPYQHSGGGAKEKIGGRAPNRIESSPEADRSGDVYDKTYRWFRKNNPDKLDKMIKTAGSRYDLDDVKEFRQIYNKFDKESRKKAYDEQTGFLKINRAESTQDRLRRCNPNYKETDYFTPYNGNCGNSVIANELRSRGLDVEARGNNIGLTASTMYKVFPGSNKKENNIKLKPKNIPKYNEAEMMLDIVCGIHDVDWAESEMRKRGTAVQNAFEKQIEKSFPDGSRGAVAITCDGYSHWMSFEVKNGKATITNPQHPGADLNLDVFAYYKESGDSRAIRLDGSKTDNKFVKSMVKNRGDRIADLKGMDWDVLGQDEINNPVIKEFLEEQLGKKWDGSWDYYDPETKKYVKQIK